jgi:hypothetical protein
MMKGRHRFETGGPLIEAPISLLEAIGPSQSNQITSAGGSNFVRAAPLYFLPFPLSEWVSEAQHHHQGPGLISRNFFY